MKSLVVATVLAAASTNVLPLNVGIWECRNLHDMGFVVATLEQTTDILGEYGLHYPAIVTDAFGETHKASMSKRGLMLTWIWGKGTQTGDEGGNEHYQIDMEMTGRAYLLNFSGMDLGANIKPDSELQCKPKKK